MLAHRRRRLRRCANINPTLFQRLVFTAGDGIWAQQADRSGEEMTSWQAARVAACPPTRCLKDGATPPCLLERWRDVGTTLQTPARISAGGRRHL